MADYQIWPATDGPGAASIDGGVTLATEFYVTTGGLYAKALRFWRADTSILGPIPGRIYEVTDASTGSPLAGTDVTFTLSGTGWLTAVFAAPVALVQGQRYRACAFFPTNYSATSAYWSSGPGSGDLVNGPLTAPSGPHATGVDQGSFVAGGALAYPTTSFNSASYWVDVTVTDTVGQTVAVGLATETGIAGAVGPRKGRAVSLAVEVGAALTVTATASLGRLAASAGPTGGLTASATRTGGPT